MAELFLTLVNRSISAGWLVLVVLILRLVLKKAPKWVHVLLWGLVAVRLVCPFSLESAFSLIPSAETISPEIMYSQEPTIHSGIPALNSAVNPVISESFAPDPSASANSLQIWVPLLSVIWLIGIAVLLAYAAISCGRLRRRVRTAVLLRDNIFQSEHVTSPFVLGFLKPRIYLPFHMNEPDVPHVVAHEQAHIRRRDHWWKPLGFLLLTVHWFNPLIWLAYALLCRDIELACDENVIQELGTQQKADYSQALLSCSVNRRTVAACPLAFGEVGVTARVKNILNYKKPTFWVIAAAIAVCMIAAVCFLTDPKESASSLSNPFGHDYSVSQIVYTNGSYSTAVTAEFKPPYRLSANQELLTYESSAWLNRGMFSEIKLTKDNFDDYFRNSEIWYGTSAGELRRNNAAAWRVSVSPGLNNPVFYYLLLQENGDIYLTYGYYDPEDETDERSDDSSIHWVFQLSLLEETGQVCQWINYLDTPREMPWGESREIEVPEYPSVKFRWTPGQVEAADQTGTTPLFDGMPIWNVYLTDLTGDGLPELCATVSYGSGMIDTHVVVYDYSGGKTYTLWDRGIYDYELSLENDRLLVTKSQYPNGEALLVGELVLTPEDNGVEEALQIGILFNSEPIRSYSFRESEDLIKPMLTLFEDGTFSFFFSVISSYLGHGAYEIENDRLTLRTDDGNFIYVFDMVDDALVFDADASSEQTWFSGLYDGAALE